MGIDCGFGSSPFGVVIARLADGKVQVIFADEFERPDYNEMLEMVLRLRYKYQVKKIFVDGANLEFIRSLKGKIGERPDPTVYIERARKVQEALGKLYGRYTGSLCIRTQAHDHTLQNGIR